MFYVKPYIRRRQSLEKQNNRNIFASQPYYLCHRFAFLADCRGYVGHDVRFRRKSWCMDYFLYHLVISCICSGSCDYQLDSLSQKKIQISRLVESVAVSLAGDSNVELLVDVIQIKSLRFSYWKP